MEKTTIIIPKQLFKSSEADRIASSLNETDPDWNYVVKHDPKGTGFSFIEVYDDEKVFVGYW